MNKKLLWITGGSGRIGSKLCSLLKSYDAYEVVATDSEVDVTCLDILERKALEIKPDVIINCASISDTVYCENRRVDAYRVNALGARNVAEVALKSGAKLIHMSSDDVFSGEHDRPKNEFDIASPDTIYGASKKAGEAMVMSLNPRNTIIRSSWVYGIGKDYFTTVCNNAENGIVFKAAIDRVSTPTSIFQLVGVINAVIENDAYGIIHAACKGMCSRYHYATTILELMGYSTSYAEAVFSGKKGARTSTVIENMMLDMSGIYSMPDWMDELKRYVAQVKQ